MTVEAQRLLRAVVEAIDGRSWGERFHSIVDALEGSGCDELLTVLRAAGRLDDRDVSDGAWRELEAASYGGDGLVVLDLVTELGQREVARAGGQRAWWRGDELLPRFQHGRGSDLTVRENH